MQTAKVTSKRSDTIITNNCVFHYALQVSIPMLILPLASLDKLFTSVLFDVLGVNQDLLIVLQQIILMNKEGSLLNTWQLLG